MVNKALIQHQITDFVDTYMSYQNALLNNKPIHSLLRLYQISYIANTSSIRRYRYVGAKVKTRWLKQISSKC